MIASDELRELFLPLSSALTADGFVLAVESLGATHVRLLVQAGTEACADCLVPRALFKQIAAQRLPNGGRDWTVDVIYPCDGIDDGDPAPW